MILAVIGAALAVAAFPPFGPGFLIIPGYALFLYALRGARGGKEGALIGGIFGLAYFGGLIWWISALGAEAVIALVVANALFPLLLGWWLGRHHSMADSTWLMFGAGSWAVMELFRYYVPFNGFEWGALGYGLADQGWARDLASWIGVSGLTVLVFLLSGALVVGVRRRQWGVPASIWGSTLLIVVMAVAVNALAEPEQTVSTDVAIVQGSTPCPFEHCPPNERLGTYLQHLELTRGIPAGAVDLVVWSEGSTGSFNADPVLNPEVGESISAEARRIGAWIMVGSDRPVSVTEWVNANVLIDRSGTYVGEYRKQHPVPFGEYIPFRPMFEWIPALDQVPRDMIPGDGPVVWDTDFGSRLGSVISFEGSFARYARQHVAIGAEVVVVATNEGSYGTSPASDQLIGMTRMRAAELGVPVIHAAVTGKSTFIDRDGVLGEATGLGTQEVLYGTFFPGTRTLYSRIGDIVMVFAALIAPFLWWRERALVGSKDLDLEED